MENIVGLLFQIALFVAVFYFLLIMPQRKKIAQHNKMISELKVGDKVITAGGIVGVIRKVKEEVFIVESNGNEVEILKSYVVSKF